MADKEYKNCPYCDEEIKAKAIKCKHCQSSLEKELDSLGDEKEQTPENEKPVVQTVNKTADLGSTLTKTGTSLMTIGCILTLLVTIPLLFIFLLVGC